MAFETEEADMPAFALVNCIATQDLERLTGLLERQDFLVIRLDGTNVTDKASFLKQAEADLPRRFIPSQLGCAGRYFVERPL